MRHNQNGETNMPYPIPYNSTPEMIEVRIELPRGTFLRNEMRDERDIPMLVLEGNILITKEERVMLADR